MRRPSLIIAVLCLLLALPAVVFAQGTTTPATPPKAPATPKKTPKAKAPVAEPAPDAGAPEASSDAGTPEAPVAEESATDAGTPEAAPVSDEEAASGQLRAPTQDAPDISQPLAEEEPAIPSPGETLSKLEQGAPPSSDPTEGAWTAPQPVITLHGYLRTRLELQDTFFLGRVPTTGTVDWPFSRFRPGEDGAVAAGGCGDDGKANSTNKCDASSLGYANMRLRLQPTLSISDDVRVHAQFDVFDNMVLGSTPQSLTTDASGRVVRSSGDPEDHMTYSQVPPDGRNSLQDSVRAKRAWAEVTNRSLGQLRFGRMGWDWGLGMFANGGDGIDSDFQTDVDRVMAITKLFGFYVMASYDFADEGFVQANRLDPQALPYDALQADDVDQYMFAVARRLSKEEQEEKLAHGDWVLNGGAFFLYRNQTLSSQVTGLDPFGDTPNGTNSLLVRRSSEAFIPDAWAQFLYGDLRLEVEAAWVIGSLENRQDSGFFAENFNLLEFGLAFQAEDRLFEKKLGLHFDFGLASGDVDVEGLTASGSDGSTAGQRNSGTSSDDTISTFRFNPNYRVDLILWRNIMQQVSGAYYFKPGISYDFIHNAFGQLLGLRLDFIYSRATSTIQTWGNDPNLAWKSTVRSTTRARTARTSWTGSTPAFSTAFSSPCRALAT